MIDDILRYNLEIRELTNNQLIPLNISLVIATGLFLWRRFQLAVADQVYVGGWQRFRSMPGVPTACALFWVFSASFLRASGAWAILAYGKDAERIVSALFIAGGLMLVPACLCCAFIFTREWAGHKFWLCVVCMMVAFGLLTH